jgi:hypothetical protein
MKQKSWKTTIFGTGGLLTLLAVALSAQFDADPTTVPDWGLVVAGVLGAVGMFFARDDNVSSEDAGAK